MQLKSFFDRKVTAAYFVHLLTVSCMIHGCFLVLLAWVLLSSHLPAHVWNLCVAAVLYSIAHLGRNMLLICHLEAFKNAPAQPFQTWIELTSLEFPRRFEDVRWLTLYKNLSRVYLLAAIIYWFAIMLLVG